MVAAEAAACGCPPLVARHSGLAEIAAGLEASYPPGSRHLAGFDERGRRRPAPGARGAARALAARTGRRCARRRARRVVERWSWASVAAHLLEPVA